MYQKLFKIQAPTWTKKVSFLCTDITVPANFCTYYLFTYVQVVRDVSKECHEPLTQQYCTAFQMTVILITVFYLINNEYCTMTWTYLSEPIEEGLWKTPSCSALPQRILCPKQACAVILNVKRFPKFRYEHLTSVIQTRIQAFKHRLRCKIQL